MSLFKTVSQILTASFVRVQYRMKELAPFQFMNWNSYWFGHESQEVELEFDLEQKEEFTELHSVN